MARMQGEEMTDETAVYAGIDVSKDGLDVALPDGAAVRVANTGPGHGRLVETLRRAGVGRVALEPTGRLHLDLWQALAAAGIGVILVNPFRARRYAEGLGQRAKTDRIDARLLARMAAEQGLEPSAPPREEMLQIRELQHLRQGLVRQATALANQAGAARFAASRRLIARATRSLSALIARTEDAIDRLIAADPALARRVEILTSIPGIGPGSARALTADLPELGQATDKEIAALAGCAPYARDSGRKTGHRRTGHGRTRLRTALHMAAVSASTHNPEIRTFATRLKAKGKHGQLVLTAALRKLLALANALIRDDRTWTPKQT
jgi:transposase